MLYHLFAGPQYYPEGGLGDYRGSFPTAAAAMAAVRFPDGLDAWAQVVTEAGGTLDVRWGQIVAEVGGRLVILWDLAWRLGPEGNIVGMEWREVRLAPGPHLARPNIYADYLEEHGHGGAAALLRRKFPTDDGGPQ